MNRREFVRNTILGSSGLMMLPSSLSAMSLTSNSLTFSDLENGFKSPPNASKPWVFWQWMNGNITKQGITLDLEAMYRIGIGGALCFNNAVGIPKGNVDYASDEWLDMVVHATKECHRLNMTFMLHNGAGYSGSGGPWVTPEMSMQQLVWTEAQFKNTRKIKGTLPKPQEKHGFYKDAYVFAYPSLSVEKGLMKDHIKKVTLDGKEIDYAVLFDENPESKIRLEREDKEDSVLEFEFLNPFEARSITIIRKAEIPKDLFDGPRDHPPHFIIEASFDGMSYFKLASVNTPALREMDTPAMQNFKATKAKYFRLRTKNSTWLSSVEFISGPRLAGWPGKANWTHGDNNANISKVNADDIIHSKDILDITEYMNAEGNLKWKAPKKGNWTIVRMGHTTTGEEPAAHPDAGKGLEIDKFRAEAVDFHYDKFLSKVIQKLDGFVGNTFNGFTTDSWEAGKQNWSITVPTQFKKNRGYEIGGWLLAMTGRIIDSIDRTERFLWDMRKTQAELLSKNYYGRCQELCHQHGLQYHAEPYGDGNLDSLQAGQYLDVPMSEFWTRYIYGSDMTSKQATSIGHVYGKNVVAAEAFTGMPLTSKWTNYPYSLKAEGDYFFSLGINRLLFHTFVHQPYTTGFPGMTMGPFGTHFDRNNTWAEQAYGWINYLRRSQYLLQQGLTVADVCYFKGDEAASGVPDIYNILPKGYVGDVVGTDALFSRFAIKNGKIVLPDGMQYKVCILANLEAIFPKTLKRLQELVDQGMILIVQNKPSITYGLSNNDKEIQDIVSEFYGNLDGVSVQKRSYGKGKLYWGTPLKEVFKELSIAPDFEYTSENQDAMLHYTHKKIEDAEFYFISNHKRRKEMVNCSFRITGYQPEFWDSETGETISCPVFEIKDNRTIISLEMKPSQSLFVMFRKTVNNLGYTSILKGSELVLSTQPFETPITLKYKDVFGDFSLSFWAKPDSYAHKGRGMLCHTSNGKQLFGENHATCGISIGQNGIKVFEEATKRETVLELDIMIEGWSYIDLIYRNNKPLLFINGVMVKEGSTSKYQVHPGLETPSSNDQIVSSFEGNYTDIILKEKSLSQEDILLSYKKGIPSLSLISAIEPSENDAWLFTQNGTYQFLGRDEKTIAINDCQVVDYNHDWQLEFLGSLKNTPSAIKIGELMSLRKHSDFNVKHFSGTMVYSKTIQLKSSAFISGRKFLLDLGRVEVIAKVYVNDKEVQLLWKEPYCADITKYVVHGKNTIKIEVTNLWANRLIGDEYLAVENEFSKDKFIHQLPKWYKENKIKPGDRTTFSVWKNFEKTDPLLESGLLGPVRMILAIEKSIEM
ncbi:glycosyl hydrolase [Mariniflexile jejuense]|uniref:Glycosyl hydrolase n=1 Tax=Mariniflexile jejuense TaxID=1173582 RepID=A0ABW3JKY1_9FLAO